MTANTVFTDYLSYSPSSPPLQGGRSFRVLFVLIYLNRKKGKKKPGGLLHDSGYI